MTDGEAYSLMPGDRVRLDYETVHHHQLAKIPRDIVLLVTGWSKTVAVSPYDADRLWVHAASRPEDTHRIELAIGSSTKKFRDDRGGVKCVILPHNLILVGRAMDYDDPAFPHVCPSCKGPAYFGAVPAAFECRWRCGR